MSDAIELDYRPASYFLPLASNDQLLSQVKGDVMRRQLRAQLEAGEYERVDALVTGERSLEMANKMLEQLHPRYMGGNYLPEMEAGEVEVARIAIESTTRDVTAVYARPHEGRIRYRVVDEYDGGSLQELTAACTDKPMTLGEFADFFLTAYPLPLAVLDNCPDDSQEGLAFFDVESVFYAQLDMLCRQRIAACYGKSGAK